MSNHEATGGMEGDCTLFSRGGDTKTYVIFLSARHARVFGEESELWHGRTLITQDHKLLLFLKINYSYIPISLHSKLLLEGLQSL